MLILAGPQSPSASAKELSAWRAVDEAPYFTISLSEDLPKVRIIAPLSWSEIYLYRSYVYLWLPLPNVFKLSERLTQMLFTAHLLIPLRPILLVMVSRLLALLRPRRRGRGLHHLPLARRPLTRLRTCFGRRLRTHRTRPQGSRQGRH